MPRSRTRTVDGDEYESVSGKIFDADGAHVPLDDRPDELVGPFARPFRGRDGIHDVTFSANLVTVYATDWTTEDVREVLAEETDPGFTHVQTLDNRRKGNIPKHAGTVIQFRMR